MYEWLPPHWLKEHLPDEALIACDYEGGVQLTSLLHTRH